MAKTRDEKIEAIASQLVQGGWSSIYSFVDSHVTDDELAEDEEDWS